MSNFTDAPQQNFRILRKILPKYLQPYLRGIRKRLQRPSQLSEPFRSVFPFTQVAIERQQNLLRLAQEIDANDVPGAVLECGVLDGGTAALMAVGTRHSGRPVHLFDSWAGLPDASEMDGAAAKKWGRDVVGSPNRVKKIMHLLQIPPQRVTFHQGWFAETFPKASIDQIALLHIDADFYDSVRLCLETWFPHLAPGSFVQIDDYSSFAGCRKAVDEFIVTHSGIRLIEYGTQTKAFYFKMPSK
jgi:O-methyltransferase